MPAVPGAIAVDDADLAVAEGGQVSDDGPARGAVVVVHHRPVRFGPAWRPLVEDADGAAVRHELVDERLPVAGPDEDAGGDPALVESTGERVRGRAVLGAADDGGQRVVPESGGVLDDAGDHEVRQHVVREVPGAKEEEAQRGGPLPREHLGGVVGIVTVRADCLEDPLAGPGGDVRVPVQRLAHGAARHADEPGDVDTVDLLPARGRRAASVRRRGERSRLPSCLLRPAAISHIVPFKLQRRELSGDGTPGW